MVDRSSIMPEQIALFEREVSDPVWAGRLSVDDPVADLGATFVCNGLVTPTQLSATSLISPDSVAGAGSRLAEVTVKAEDGLLANRRSGNPSAPACWDVAELGAAILLPLDAMPGEYADWRFGTEVYVIHGGAAYLVLGDFALRHRVLSGDEVGITFVQRLLPFVRARPDEMTGTLVLLVSVPGRLAALGGLRGYRRAFLESGRACAWLQAGGSTSEEIVWEWDTEFYDDAAARLLGVDGIERVVTHIGYQRIAMVPEVPADLAELDAPDDRRGREGHGGAA